MKIESLSTQSHADGRLSEFDWLSQEIGFAVIYQKIKLNGDQFF